MNKAKAIQLLERLQDPEPYEPMLTKDAYDAIQMAIDALSADGDTISREAAIEAIDEIESEIAEGLGFEYEKWRKYFCDLPPVQTEQLEPDQSGDLWITVPDIDKVTRIYVQESKSKFCRIFYEEQEQPEPYVGHWVNGYCDKCNEHAPFWAMASTYHESNFCPNCGAEMEGEDE